MSAEAQNIIPDIPVITLGRADTNHVVISQPDISRQHAHLLVCSPTTFLIEDLNSKHGCYVNGLRVSRKVVALTDTIRLASYEIVVQELINQLKARQEAIRSATQRDTLDYTEEFKQLKQVFDDYPKLRKECRNREKLVRMWSVIGGSALGVATVLTGGTAPALVALSSAGLSMLIPTLASNLLSTDEKLEIIDKEYREKYRCPNPKCKDPFGMRDYEALSLQGKCARCKAIWIA